MLVVVKIGERSKLYATVWDLRLLWYLIEEVGGFVHSVFTNEDVLFAGSFGTSFTESVQVHHTTASHDGIKGDNLINRHPEDL